MTTFQLLLLIIAAGIFYLFFKQLFSGEHPKRGIDFEAKLPDEQIGGINRPDKTFSTPEEEPSRMEQLLNMADEAIEKNDLDEAKKALDSALILEPENIDALQKMVHISMRTEAYEEAKEYCEKLIFMDKNDDMAHVLLANALHKLGEQDAAKIHHQKAIMIDPEYAPHHFNYANTLYDLGQRDQALVEYKKAYALDSTLSVAKEMIETLEVEK